MMGALASRAASSDATTVDEEVTFYNPVRSFSITPARWTTYNGWDSKFLLVTVFKQLLNIISDDDTGLST